MVEYKIFCMLDIIENNPYRLLGLYANSSVKEKISNFNRLKAFAKVGKELSFPLDLTSVLNLPIKRTLDIVKEAESKLVLPNEQVKYAQFWFVKNTAADESAFDFLVSGSFEKATSIWKADENVSSLQNLVVCSLIQNKLSFALKYAYKLYTNFNDAFVILILGGKSTVSLDNLGYLFLDILVSFIGVDKVASELPQDSPWKKYLLKKYTDSLIDRVSSRINDCKKFANKPSTEKYKAALKLKAETQEDILKLKSILFEDDLQYQMISDSLAMVLLNYSSEYFFASEVESELIAAKDFYLFIMSFLVNSETKQLCKHSFEIISQKLKELPVKNDIAKLEKAVKIFCDEKRSFSFTINFLNESLVDLNNIKNVLGKNSKDYFQLSYLIVDRVLYAINNNIKELQNEIVEVVEKKVNQDFVIYRFEKYVEALKTSIDILGRVEFLPKDEEITASYNNSKNTCITEYKFLQQKLNELYEQKAIVHSQNKDSDSIINIFYVLVFLIIVAIVFC